MIDYNVDVFELAACRGVDPEVFFPWAKPGKARYHAQVVEAKAVCAVCPVRSDCLDFALATDDPARRFGVFGGLDPFERAALAKLLRAPHREPVGV